MSANAKKSRLIYGCMGLGGSWDSPDYTPADVDLAAEALHAAADIGITTIDTADIYRQTGSEAVIGEVLSRDPELRATFEIQTKCGILPGWDGGPTRYNLSGRYITESIAGALDRLQVDSIDVMILHRPDPLMRPDDIANALGAALDSGIIKSWGVSNMGPWQLEYLKDVPGQAACNQIELSLRARSFVEQAMSAPATASQGSLYPAGTVEYCAAHGIDVQAWSPMAQGVYSALPGTPSAEGRTPEHLETFELVRQFATAHRTTPETIVLWWLTHHPAGIRPVIGTTNVARIHACADANNRDSGLSRTEWYQLLTAARGGNTP